MLQLSLICLLLNIFKESSGQIVTQTPAFLQKNPGDRVDIQCKASSSVNTYMNFYQLIRGQKSKLLIHGTTNRFEGTPDRFSGRGSGTDFTFTINGMRSEDEGEYYCSQAKSLPLHNDTLQYKNLVSDGRLQK
uniref:Ig-like domain-containing protein n=1 Tax=Anolis carolinensis TaxID=28377 RepID=A0A803TMH9_ANOCA